MFPMDHKPVTVGVEYTANGKQVARVFGDAYAARRFYAAKVKAGANPRVFDPNKEPIMSKQTTTDERPQAQTATASKGKAKPQANGKASKPVAKSSTGNLPLEDAKKAVLKQLCKGRATRSELKAVAPYGNYTALCQDLEGSGSIKSAKHDGDTQTYYEITAKGRKEAGK